MVAELASVFPISPSPGLFVPTLLGPTINQRIIKHLPVLLSSTLPLPDILPQTNAYPSGLVTQNNTC